MNNLIALTLFLLAASAPAVASDWLDGIGDTGTYYWAGTVNTSGNMLGQYCYPKEGTCYYMVSLDATCEPDGKYVVLINADSGAYRADLGCGWKYKNKTVYLFRNFDEMDSIVRRSVVMGIAVAMDSGHFQVFRFSLAGSVESLDRMHSIASKAMDEQNKRRTSSLPAKEQI